MSADPPILTSLFGGRALLPHTDATGELVAGWPELAAEAVRAISHITSHGYSMPVPVLYEVLGDLQLAGSRLAQACRQLADGLQRSATEFDLYEDDDGDPAARIREAVRHLTDAATAAAVVGAAAGGRPVRGRTTGIPKRAPAMNAAEHGQTLMRPANAARSGQRGSGPGRTDVPDALFEREASR